MAAPPPADGQGTGPTTIPDSVDPFSPENRANPHPVFAALREAAPVHRSPRQGTGRTWVVLNHADATRVLRDPSSSVQITNRAGGATAEHGMARQNPYTMLFLDPPDHTRLRGLVAQAFTPRRVEALRPRIQSLVDELLDDAAGRGTDGGARSMDVVADLAHPLPVAVICELLGVPTADRAPFPGWSADATLLLDSFLDPETQARGVTAVTALFEYFGALLAERRDRPGDDLISALLRVEEAGERLSPEELLATVILLFVAGHETTVNLLGNGTLALLRHPDQLRRLRDDPGLARTAVEELLRFDSPVTATARFATAPMTLSGVEVAPGDEVVVSITAANRDPAAFADPDRLDLARTPNPHLAFGGGPHFCLGGALARAEGQVAFTTLLRRLPDLALAEAENELAYRDHQVLRGLRRLRVTW